MPPVKLPPTIQPEPDAVRLLAFRLLAEEPSLSQREIAVRLGVSLGKTHYVLRALLDKGWIKMSNFRRSDNKLAYRYLLTPAGMREKAALTSRFLARKEAEYEALKATIDELRRHVGAAGINAETNP